MEYQVGERLLRAVVSLSFKTTQVLEDLEFEIYNTLGYGQIVALLGPSGIGKTQLFRCIAGLQVPTEGGIYINNHTEPVRQGEVGVVAQDYPLIESRTVLGNLVRAFEVSKKDVVGGKTGEKIAMEYLERFGLTRVVKNYPSQLSGGQRQRVAIIQQMMCSKHFLLMDEPFANLDILGKERARILITEMANAHELNTIIVTTHDIRMACATADRVILLGRDHDEAGNVTSGARVVGDYDLKALDLCWIPGVTETQKFADFVKAIEGQFASL
ncbi:MAG: ATP-binding cassette domain-containing protein [Patescibacteria group bacterium]